MRSITEKKLIGASLYVPATHIDLSRIARGELLGEIRSIIFCTEDAVAEKDLNFALSNLALAMREISLRQDTNFFVRVRNPVVMHEVLKMPGSAKLTGFVLPKITRQNFDLYFNHVRETNHLIMPTLETLEVFDETEMRLFRRCIQRDGVRERILALRIGGNDLLALLGIRRPRSMTIYRTPLGQVISRLATTFLPHGFTLTAPVFEHLDNLSLLEQEIQEDLAHGLMGKTAIHPSQVPLIERHYRVQQSDVETAMRLMAPDSPAIFKLHDSMCEVATHRAWAYGVVAKAQFFGIRDTDTSKTDPAILSARCQEHNPLQGQSAADTLIKHAVGYSASFLE